MMNQVFTPLSKLFDDLFPKLLACNLIAKMPQRAISKHFSAFYNHNA